ncbi:MAG: hypothetical protein H0V14_06150 [Chitinophagaceae bacterium]|nr:hypothetical protein [Chitinophagaceae bacterium]
MQRIESVVTKCFEPTALYAQPVNRLGLSLSHDITKAHGGEIKVKTKEACPDEPFRQGKVAEFIFLKSHNPINPINPGCQSSELGFIGL